MRQRPGGWAGFVSLVLILAASGGAAVASSSDEIDRAIACRRTLAYAQAFEILGGLLLGNGFDARAVQAIVDTAVAADDPESALAIAAGIPGFAGRVLAAHVTAATTETAPARPLRELLAREAPAGEAKLDEAYEHVASVARRLGGPAEHGRALARWIEVLRRRGMDCRPRLAALVAGPAAWGELLLEHLAAADPLDWRHGEYDALLERLAGTDGKATERMKALSDRLEARTRADGSAAGAAAGLMLLRVRASDRSGAAFWARRSAELAASWRPEMASGSVSGTAPHASPRTAPEPGVQDGEERALRLVDLMARSGLDGHAVPLVAALERRWLARLQQGPPAGVAASRAADRTAALHARLGCLAMLDRRDEKAALHLATSLQAGGDPAPAFAALTRHGAIASMRARSVAALDATTSRGPAALSTAARILDRAGDFEGALVRYRALVATTGDPAAALRGAWLEGRLGRPRAAVELLGSGLAARPGDAELVAELVRQSAREEPGDRTIARLGALHPAPPPDRERALGLLTVLEGLASGPAGRSALTTICEAWLTAPGGAPPETRLSLAAALRSLGRSAPAAALATDALNGPPPAPEWTEKLLELVRLSSPAALQTTAVRALAGGDAAGRGLLHLARARSLAASRQATAALHACLLALDQSPASKPICAELIRLVDRYAHPGYLMGAFYLKSSGNPLYAAFQARYRARHRAGAEAEGYYRAAIRAYPEDRELALELARLLEGRGQDRKALQVYVRIAECSGWRYDRAWGPPLVRTALRSGDGKLFLQAFEHWLTQPRPLETGIVRTFLRLAREAALLPEAAELLRKTVAAWPCLITLHEGLALTLRELGRPEDAAAAEAARDRAVRSPWAVLTGVALDPVAAAVEPDDVASAPPPIEALSSGIGIRAP